MDETLPTEAGAVRPEISDLVESEGWLPPGENPQPAPSGKPSEELVPFEWEAQRPETD